jgi:hypothetical protein
MPWWRGRLLRRQWGAGHDPHGFTGMSEIGGDGMLKRMIDALVLP